PKSIDFFAEWKKKVLQGPYISYAGWMETIGAENKQGNITADECREIIRVFSMKPLYDGYKILILWLPEFLAKTGNILLKILEEPPPRSLFLLLAENEENILPTILSRTQIMRIPLLSDESVREQLKRKYDLQDE